MFGSNYIWVHLFSIMKWNKTKYCSQLRDLRPNSRLSISKRNTRPTISCAGKKNVRFLIPNEKNWDSKYLN